MDAIDKIIVIVMVCAAAVTSVTVCNNYTDKQICKLKGGAFVESKCLVDKEIK